MVNSLMVNSLPQIFQDPSVKTCLPTYIKFDNPSVVYLLTYPIKFKIFNLNKFESGKLCTVHTKNLLTCQHALCGYVLTCQSALRTYVLTYQSALRAYVLTYQHASSGATFSFSLPLLLKLQELLVKFKSLIAAFPQQCEFIHKPSLLFICRLEKREHR